MHWFKHDTAANMDAKLQEVLLDYGLEGYGLYWYCIELIAGKISKDNITFALEHDARIIARNTGSTVVKVEEMMKRFVALGLFESDDGKLTCMKLAKRLDQSMTSNPGMRSLISKIKNHDKTPKSHDEIMTASSGNLTESCKNRIEEKRIDKKVQVKSPKAQKVKFDPLLVSHPKLNQAAWVEWVEYRKSKGKKISEAAAKKQVRFLTDYNFDLQQASVDSSISNDYQGLFEPKVNTGVQHGQPARHQQPKPSLVDRVKQQAEQRLRDQEASATGHREFSLDTMAQTHRDVRVQVCEPVRGDTRGDLGNVLNGDYWQTNG